MVWEEYLTVQKDRQKATIKKIIYASLFVLIAVTVIGLGRRDPEITPEGQAILAAYEKVQDYCRARVGPDEKVIRLCILEVVNASGTR